MPLTCPASRSAHRKNPLMQCTCRVGRLTAKHSAADFTTDANLQKKIWKGANWVQFDHSMDGKANLRREDSRRRGLDREVHLFRFLVKYEDLNIFEEKMRQKSDGTVE